MATTVPITELAAHLRLAVARTARRLRQEATVGLSPSLNTALASVERHGPLTPSELAVARAHPAPDGDEADRRARGAWARRAHRRSRPTVARRSSPLTPAGAALLEEIRTRKDAFLAQRLRGLSAEDRATLARAADLLEGLLEEERR